MRNKQLVQLHAWCTLYGWQSDVCRVPDKQSHNSENTRTTGRPNALVVWQERGTPRTLLLREALMMSGMQFVCWLVDEQKQEVA